MDGMNVLAVRDFTKAVTDWMRAGNVSMDELQWFMVNDIVKHRPTHIRTNGVGVA